eukprot:TRINITY_DN2962_c0_g2_i4.p2 TRINITY_DN2962_c0_g2~~TRINITY_DN2962_c0_g2_i4.p2  ORF type:complete len:176 (+),score=32.85 TRINITY_DN2962_c0_g2_i4:827-1354(+)
MNDRWVNKDNKKEQISVGSWVVFEIVEVDKSVGIFGITGSMQHPNSGPIITFKKQQYQDKDQKTKPKKRQRDETNELEKPKKKKKTKNGIQQHHLDNWKEQAEKGVIEIIDSSDNDGEKTSKKRDKKEKKKKKKERKEKKLQNQVYPGIQQQHQQSNGYEETSKKKKKKKQVEMD